MSKVIIVFTSGRRWVYDSIVIKKRFVNVVGKGIEEQIPLDAIERIIREKPKAVAGKQKLGRKIRKVGNMVG